MKPLISILLLSGLLGGQAYAQSVQPTGQSPETGNPQTMPSQNLVAPTGFLQGNSGSQVLGTSLDQLPSGRIRVESNGPSNQTQPNTYDDPLSQSPDQLSASGFKLGPKFTIVAGALTFMLGLLVIYLASRRKIIGPL